MSNFQLDPDKAVINRRKHDLNLILGAEIFDGPFIEEEDDRIDYGESRFIAIGPVPSLGDRICAVVYTWRGIQRRLISFRKAKDREIERYRASHA